MRPVWKSQNFQFIPLARQFSFLDGFFKMAMPRLHPRPVWNEFVFTFIPVWIHAGLKWDWSELFLSRSHVNIYYIEIVNMFTWDWYGNQKKFSIYSPCQAIFFFFRWLLLACVVHLQFQCQGYIRDRSEMYLCLHSFRSEFMLVWSQSARSSRRNDLRLVWVIFAPVSCKHLL
jgi:hypothetical protein